MTSPLHEAAFAFFEEDGWYPTADDDQITVGVTGDHGEFGCFTHTFEDRGLIVFFAVAPVRVPPERVEAATEFVTRANWGLQVGNFELHADDGIVRYRTSVDLESVEPDNRTPELVKALLREASHTGAAMMDKHLGALVSVTHGDREPLDALMAVEL